MAMAALDGGGDEGLSGVSGIGMQAVGAWVKQRVLAMCRPGIHVTAVCPVTVRVFVFVCLCVLLYLFSACFVVSFVLCFSLSQTQNPCAWGRFTLEWRMMEERLGMEHARPMAYVMWVVWCIWSGVCENICAGLVFVHMCLYGGCHVWMCV